MASILVAAALLHGQLASALISRGDDVLRRGNPVAALRYYHRALFFNHHLDDAIDRVTLVALMTKNAGAMQLADHLTADALRRFPSDRVFLEDHALIELRLLRYRSAMKDFERLGFLQHDWQGFAFASFIARRIGNAAMAKHDWVMVTRLNPHFARLHRKPPEK